MRVTVRYFAAIREAIGTRGETREVPEGTSAAQLIDLLVADHPAIAPLSRSAALMVNHAYAAPEQTLREGDELALIPPVSGGAGAHQPCYYRVTEDPITLAEVEALVAGPSAGAVVSFAGSVRDHARGRTVLRLEYEAYPEAAEKMLAQIGGEIAERWPVERVAIAHRMGTLAIGEISVVIAVAAAHRGDAFAACRYAIDRIKEIVPIWKKEHYAGGESWIGSEAEYQAAFGTSGRADRAS